MKRSIVAEEWQPMDTAPKDGTEIVILTKSYVKVIAHYQPGGFCVEDHPAIDEGWYFWQGYSFGVVKDPIKLKDPIKWTPLTVPSLRLSLTVE